MKPRLLVCFSGGRTSAYMTYRLLREKADEYDIRVVFANTGQENEATLEFVHQCDVQLGFPTVWVEADVWPDKGERTGYRRVTFETASRNGEPFEAVIAKYGVPNQNYKHCTRELKEMPIHSWLWATGWEKGEYTTAIGMRADEPRRTKTRKPDRQLRQIKVYPLAHWWPTDKEDVLDFWEWMPFDLQLAEHRGNCKWCYKKSQQKLRRVWQETPDDFAFPARMESLYGDVGGNVVEGPRRIFREYRSTRDLITLFELTGPTDEPIRASAPGACDEECNPFGEDEDL